MQSILRKNMFAVLKVRIRMSLRLKKFGKTQEIRTQKIIRNSLMSSAGCIIRTTARERAKDVMYKFLSEAFEREVMVARVRKTFSHIQFMQRMIKIK